MSFSDRIITLREHFGFKSQQEFANLLEVAKQTINSIETGSGKASFKILVALKEQFPQLNLNWLIVGTGQMLEEENNNSKSDIVNVQQNHSGTGNNKFNGADCKKALYEQEKENQFLKGQIIQLKELNNMMLDRLSSNK